MTAFRPLNTFLDDFLADVDAHEIHWSKPTGAPAALETHHVLVGQGGPGAIEIAIATSAKAPTADEVRKLWTRRWGTQNIPAVLVAAYPDSTAGDWYASVCGTRTKPVVVPDVPTGQLERILTAVLAAPDGLQAERAFHRLLVSQKDQLIVGVNNQGLFATHELANRVPARDDWTANRDTGKPLLAKRGLALFAGLGYTASPLGSTAHILTADSDRRALALVLTDTELFDRPTSRFGTTSPIAYGLKVAKEQGLSWVVVTKGTQVRLYPTRTDIGVGRKGAAETYLELDLATLETGNAAYLPLLFAPEALTEHGTVLEILDASADHATGLGSRLRDRVYTQVVPDLAVAIGNHMATAKDGPLDEADLREAYHRTLTILFRLLFVSYAEDRGLLPYQRNPLYTKKALKTLAREFTTTPDMVFDGDSTDRWTDLQAVWRAIDDGNTEWDVPAYNGGLFAVDAEFHPSGHAIRQMRLTNAEIGPALMALLIDTSPDGHTGPVDFSAMSVRHFGSIYEGLLESSLSVAPTDLIISTKDGTYLPAPDNTSPPDVPAGEIYFHNASGARKSTGSYYTKEFAVEHLLDTALDPALNDHLDHIKTLLADGDEAAAAEKFFDFRVADLAMGSGHFLVAAIDHIEDRFSAFLTEHPIAAVADELARLAAVAEDHLGANMSDIEIEPNAVLRRQIARRCIYGLDLNPMAVELARLAIWIHTFVPGLPMSSLDHGLRVGNSLTGIGTIDEALDVFEPKRSAGQMSLFGDQIEEALTEARKALVRVARTDEATKKEVKDAARERAKAMTDAADARALLDAALGVRLGIIGNPTSPEDAITSGNSEAVQGTVAELQSAHLPYYFPEVFMRGNPGFDAILGNPPWDKIRHEPQQFWVVRDPGLNAMPASKRDSHVRHLRATRPQDAAEEDRERQLRESLQDIARSGYSLLGSGHFDFAKLFAERFLHSLRRGGSLGVVMPQSLLLLGGWSKLRTALLDRGDAEIVEARNANGWLFDDVHRSYAVTLLAIRPPRYEKNTVRILPGVTSLAKFHAVRRHGIMTMTVSDLDDLSDGRIVPWFNSPDDARVFDKMRHHPKLGDGHGWITGKTDSRWDFSGSGKHKGHAATSRTGARSWGVLMTRHVDQYAIADDPIQRWINNPAALSEASPTRDLDSNTTGVTLGREHPLIVYRFPSRNDDSRTVIATALPESGYLYSTGYAHGIQHPAATPTGLKLALLGYLNSIVADWWARRFVDRHVGARIVRGLPLPSWEAQEITSSSALVTELLARGGLATLSGGHALESSTEFAAMTSDDLKVELDILAFNGFQMSVEDAAVVMSDFKDKAASLPTARREAIMQHLGSSKGKVTA